jgi:hypothetical protein
VKHIVQFSTGLASAEIAWRLAHDPGIDRADVILLTADTRVEDADNWRFAREIVTRLGCQWIVLADGRTPMQVGRDRKVVPNNRMAVCSQILKRELLRRWIDEHIAPTDAVIYLGFDWTETHRIDAAIEPWKPYTVAAPLADPPYTSKPDLLAAFRGRGIEPPRLYGYGFPHANCGGACVRGGQAQWHLLLRTFPERYRQWEAEEDRTRQLLGKDVAILRDRTGGQVKPLTLRRFRERLDAQPGLFDCDDWGACGCTEAATA